MQLTLLNGTDYAAIREYGNKGGSKNRPTYPNPYIQVSSNSTITTENNFKLKLGCKENLLHLFFKTNIKTIQ